MLTSNLITQGRIFWLLDPFKDEESEDSDGQPYDLPDTYNGIEIGLLGHPVMVLHTLDRTTDVAVFLLQLTTLRGRDLEDRRYTYKYQYTHQFFLAVHPTEPPCPFFYPQLRLLHNLRLRKSRYLCIKKRYTIPLNMLEHYDQSRPELRYQITAESFAAVANTFAMKISSASRGSCNGDHWTHSSSNVRRRPSSSESNVAITHGEPDLATEGLPLAKTEPSAMPQSEPARDSKTMVISSILTNLPSAYTDSLEKADTTGLGLLLTSGGSKALVSTGIADVVGTAVENSREVLNAVKIRFYKDDA